MLGVLARLYAEWHNATGPAADQGQRPADQPGEEAGTADNSSPDRLATIRAFEHGLMGAQWHSINYFHLAAASIQLLRLDLGAAAAVEAAAVHG